MIGTTNARCVAPASQPGPQMWLSSPERSAKPRPRPAIFDREFSRVKEEIDTQSERLRAIGIRRRGLEQRSDELRARQYAEASAMRFVGSLEEALKQYDALAVDSDLVQEIAELEERVSGLHAWLNARKVDESIDRAKAYVSGAAA